VIPCVSWVISIGQLTIGDMKKAACKNLIIAVHLVAIPYVSLRPIRSSGKL